MTEGKIDSFEYKGQEWKVGDWIVFDLESHMADDGSENFKDFKCFMGDLKARDRYDLMSEFWRCVDRKTPMRISSLYRFEKNENKPAWLNGEDEVGVWVDLLDTFYRSINIPWWICKKIEGKMKSHYIFQETESSFCPKCDKNVYLMTNDMAPGTPNFYICFDCKWIGQIGVGEVENKSKEKENVDKD